MLSTCPFVCSSVRSFVTNCERYTSTRSSAVVSFNIFKITEGNSNWHSLEGHKSIFIVTVSVSHTVSEIFIVK